MSTNDFSLLALLSTLSHPHPYPSHGQCWFWNPWLTITHSIGDIVTWCAYTAIPLIITYIYRNGKFKSISSTYPALWRWGAAFIFFCSLTHLGSVAEIWFGGMTYYITAMLKVITGVVSCVFVWSLWKLKDELIFVTLAVKRIMDEEETAPDHRKQTI